MNNVTYWNLDIDGTDIGMVENKYGEYVEAADYDDLKSKYDDLVNQITDLYRGI